MYPVELLHTSNYKKIIPLPPSNFLIRSTSTSSPSDLYDDLGKIRNEHICNPDSQVDDLSTSILGVFNVEHNKIELIGEKVRYYSEYCEDFTEQVEIPVYEQDFIFNSSRGFWTVEIMKLHNEEVSFVKGDESTAKAQCIILHTPARWNFWHVSIRWKLSEDGRYLNDIKKPWRRQLRHAAIVLIRSFASAQLPQAQQEITRSLYSEAA